MKTHDIKKRYIFGLIGVAALVFTYVCIPLIASAVTCPEGGLCNPLKDEFGDIPKFIKGALEVLVKVVLPIIALFLVVAGFMFVKARGNSGELTKVL